MPGLSAKLAIGILIAMLLALQFNLWLGDFGLIRYWHLQKQVQEQGRANDQLKARNRRLQAEVFDLKHGTDALEERARSQLGMIKKGEQFYQVIEENDHHEKDAGRQSQR